MNSQQVAPHRALPLCRAGYEPPPSWPRPHLQVRALMPHELVTAHTFLHKNGSRVVLDGVGQAWQRGKRDLWGARWDSLGEVTRREIELIFPLPFIILMDSDAFCSLRRCR